MIFCETLETSEVMFAASSEIARHLRVVVTSNEIAVADNSAIGIGVAHLFDAGDSVQTIRPRTPGRSAVMVADGALDAYDPVYAKGSGKIGDLTAAEPLVGYTLEAAAGDGSLVTVMWA